MNSLPASLGFFPLHKVSDFKSRVPGDWNPEGHMIPMWPQEAMWIGFNRPANPVALLVGAGMVNAVTGARLMPQLDGGKQNYLVIPPQPWLDGFKPKEGERVFQFVAAELGKGETAEEQILGSAEFGGLQLGLFASQIPLIPASRPHEYIESGEVYSFDAVRTRGGMKTLGVPREMGLGVGGAIKQKIYPDPYLVGRSAETVWGKEPVEKAYIYIVHALDWESLTGQQPPASPITYQTYQMKGLPWFGLPDGSWGDVEGSETVSKLKPVSGDPDPVNATSQEQEVNPRTKGLW